MLVFLVGSFILSILIARQNEFGIKDTLRAMCGMKSFKRNLVISLMHAVTVIVPLVLWMYLSQACGVPG